MNCIKLDEAIPSLLEKISELKPYIKTDMGFTIKIDEKPLSKGCQACKNGAWICIVMGMDCNLDCEWCPQDRSKKGIYKDSVTWANGGDLPAYEECNIEDIDLVIEENSHISGISYTGGEPLLYLEKILHWAGYFNKQYPQIYQWIYTNGELLNEETCKELAKVGIKEIRVDLAATNYTDHIIEKLQYCKEYFKYVGVEVPHLPWKKDRLLECLHRLDKIGIDFFNLHDLIINNFNDHIIDKFGLNRKKIFSDERFINIVRYFPTTIDIFEVLKYIRKHQFSFAVNNCNLMNYINQNFGYIYQLLVSQDGYAESFDEFRELALSQNKIIADYLDNIS